VVRNLQQAMRALRRAPSFAMPVLVILALGIGSSTALFSVVHALMLNPLPYPESDRIYWAWATDSQQDSGTFARAEALQLAQRQRAFSDVAAMHFDVFNARFGDVAERLQGMVCSSSFSAVMGTPALWGRTFQAGDDAGSPRAVLLSYGLWQERFQGKREVVGTTLLLNEEPFLVAGVMPPEFRFPSFAQVWVTAAPGVPTGKRINGHENIVARLRPGVRLAQAEEDVRRVFSELASEDSSKRNESARLESLQERLVSGYRATLYGLLGAAGLLLLITCASTANLFVARGLSQQPAWSVRVALGAGWRHLLQPVLAESLVLSLGGALVGVILGSWGLRALLLAFPRSLPRAWEIGLHPAVAVFALITCAVAAVIASLLTLLRLSPRRLAESLRSSQQSAHAGLRGGWLSSGLALAQVALGLLLLTAALLVGAGVERVLHAESGMRRDFFFFRVVLPEKKYPSADMRTRFFHRLIEQLSALRGVEALAASNSPPQGPQDGKEAIVTQETPALRLEDAVRTGVQSVSSNYFATLGIPVLAGRAFSVRDMAGASRLLIVNEKLAKHLWPGKSALGRHVRLASMAGDAWLEIVGVVGNARHGSPTDEFAFETYVPYWQRPPRFMNFSVRSRVELAAILRAMKQEILLVDPDMQVGDVFTAQGYVDTWLAAQRFQRAVMQLFGGMAFLLAVAGVYSMISYRVAQRKREFGVRLALGAEPAAIIWLVLRWGVRLTLAGLLTGLATALALLRYAPYWFPEPVPLDAISFAAGFLLLAATSLAACIVPALRASRVNPNVALRQE